MKFILQIFFLLPIFLMTNISSAKVENGIRFTAGVRHDKMRMCVASPKGEPNGPMGDISWVLYSEHFELNIPVGRPLLFASAFDMLQFEPEMSYTKSLSSNWIAGVGLGLVFHSGPDWEHDLDDRGTEFSAWGPRASLLLGKTLGSKDTIAIRAFASPLSAKNRDSVTVLGAGLEYTIK